MIAVSFAVAAAFNLTCTIQQSSTGSGLVPQSYTLIMRVDLNAMRWCAGGCAETRPIKSVTETEIMFEPSNAPEIKSWSYTKVNRESGAYAHDSRLGRLAVASSGVCEKRDFSGFPTVRF